LVFNICIIQNVCAGENNPENEITDQLIDAQSDTDEIRNIQNQLKRYSTEDIKQIIPGYDPESIINNAARGNFKFDLNGIINRVLMMLFKEIYINISILIKLMVLIVLCAVLRNLQTAFLSNSVGELAFYICYIVLVSILLVSFSETVKSAFEIIDAMVNFMYASIPVLITLMISSGNITSGGVLQPILLSIVQICATIIKNVFIPLIILSTVISVVSNVSEKVQVSRLAGVLKSITGWSLGIILTVFIAVVSLQGSMGAVVDGVTSKTAKFAIGVFIPVAGKYLADAADAVVGCTLLIKNAVGIAIMIGIIVICILPILKMLAIIILYRMTCVLMEPLGESRIIKCISDVAGSITFLMGILASVAFMFLITVTALITASNLSAMVR
jgi:stage III sporulation protein AE